MKDAGLGGGLPGNLRVLKENERVPERKNEFYEDWSSPVLPKGMQSEVALIDKTDRLGFTRELIHAQWREYDPIDLHVIRPAGVKNPPLILYLYSYPTTSDRYKDDKFCRFLTRNGFAAVGFDPAVTGQRFHDRPTQEWFVSELQESLSTTTHDVQMILNYLSSRADFDMTRVGIWSDGSGAGIAIMAAAVDSRIKALDLLDPWGDWSEWLAKSSLLSDSERTDYLKPDFLLRVRDLDPLKYLPQLKTQIVRMQWIDQGVTVTPENVRKKMESAAPANVKIVHYKDKETFFREVATSGKSFEWLTDQLGSRGIERSSTGTMKAIAPAGTNSDR